MESFKQSGKITKQAHVKIPDGHFEEEHGRKGFFGRVSHLYHQKPLTSWTNIEGDLKPRCLPPIFDQKLEPNNFYDILENSDCIISIAQYENEMQNYFRNADYDELFFIHNGKGKIETTYGHLEITAGDYVILPRGITYKIFTKETLSLFRVESSSEFEQPSRGILGPNALYDQTAITVPEAQIGSEKADSYTIRIKRQGKISKVTYPHNPLDVVGWKGSLYPWKLSIYDYCPIMSHKYHIPPSAHTTLVTKGFVVCSFVARPLEDSKEGVLKVPFYHSNIDFDEVLFYHRGNFFSRDNIDPGALTFHPQGIHHGPHPNALKNADDKVRTDEFSVMIDSKKPLNPTPWFSENENKDYWKSWMES